MSNNIETINDYIDLNESMFVPKSGALLDGEDYEECNKIMSAFNEACEDVGFGNSLAGNDTPNRVRLNETITTMPVDNTYFDGAIDPVTGLPISVDNGTAMYQQAPRKIQVTNSIYDPMLELCDSTSELSKPSKETYIVDTIGLDANQRHNVKSAKTGQIMATCMLHEAASKIVTLMNSGKLFTDVDVINCLIKDQKFSQTINEMRNVKASGIMNESSTTKFNMLKNKALEIKKSLK